MSSEGETILKSFKQIRRFCRDVSKLITTVEDRISKAGWTNNETSYALSDISWSYKIPEKWMPIEVHRYYKHKEHPNRLAFVSILFDDEWQNAYSIDEPLVTAGFLDYKKLGKIDSADSSYFRCYGYLWRKCGWRADGSVNPIDPELLPLALRRKPEKLFESGKVFAVPLTRMKNSVDVQTQIVDNLIRILTA